MGYVQGGESEETKAGQWRGTIWHILGRIETAERSELAKGALTCLGAALGTTDMTVAAPHLEADRQ